MKQIYILTEAEIKAAKDRVQKLRQNALICRDSGDAESSREFYLRAKGAAEMLEIIGIYKKAGD